MHDETNSQVEDWEKTVDSWKMFEGDEYSDLIDYDKYGTEEIKEFIRSTRLSARTEVLNEIKEATQKYMDTLGNSPIKVQTYSQISQKQMMTTGYLQGAKDLADIIAEIKIQ